jgi:hypothetical protein
MKLIFFVADEDPEGWPVARRVLTVEDAGERQVLIRHDTTLPALPRLGHWREFADFFEIV